MYLDSNFFIHAVLNTEKKGHIARKTIRKMESGELSCATSPLVLDEVVWVIMQKQDQDKAVKVWKDIIQIPNLKLLPIDDSVSLRVPHFMEKHKLKPRDAIQVAVVVENAIRIIVSDDSSFDSIPEIERKRIEELA